MFDFRPKLKAAALIALTTVPCLAAFPILPASAHHGWSTFDSRYAYYVAGEITYVRWGNPHSEVHLRVDTTTLPDRLRDRALPEGADQHNGQATLASARPYDREHQELHLVLAGPEWMERWGMSRPLEVGERIEVVGFMDASGGDQLRPVMFWLENGQGVWQQLTAFAQEPLPAPQN